MTLLSGNAAGGPAPTLLSPTAGGGGAMSPNQSPLNPNSKQRKNQRAPQTFAGMQQAGMARPSPQGVQQQAQQQAMQMAQAQPAMGGAPQAQQQPSSNAQAGRNFGTYQQSAGVQQLGQPLMQSVMAMLQDPTGGLNEAAQSSFDRQNTQLGREFATMRDGMNENFAARGLDASTIAASKLGDLGARQADAQSNLAAQVQEKLINDRAAATQAAINAALGLRGQEASLGRDEFVVNRDTADMAFDNKMQIDNAAQSASQFDRRLGLDTTLGMGGLDLQRQNLALNRDQFAQGQQNFDRTFTYNSGRDATNDQFRNNEFDWRQGVDTRNFNYGAGQDAIRNNQWTAQFDRQGDQFDRTFNQNQSQFDTNQNNWRDQFTRQGDQFNQTFNQNRDQFNQGQQNFDRTFTFNQNTDTRNFNAGQQNQNTNNILQLLNGMGMGSLSPDVMASLYRTLGIQPPGSTAQPRDPLPYQSGADDAYGGSRV